MSGLSTHDAAGSAAPRPSVPDKTPASCASHSSEAGSAASSLAGAASSASALVVLYVFSGPHLGAELELPAGRFVIGSDDSCDVILRGAAMAARHAALDVGRGPGGLPEVSVTPLDGPVRAGDHADDIREGEISPAAGKAWHLGLTCLAWNRPGIIQPVLEPSPVGRPGASAPSSGPEGQAERAMDQAITQIGDGAANSMGATASSGNHGGTPEAVLAEEAPSMPPRAPRGISSLKRGLLLLAVLVCLGGLSLAVGPPPVTPEQYAGILEQKLRAVGLDQLRAVPFAQGVEVRGVVAGDKELTVLRDRARELHFPVYLDKVAVRDDQVRAVARAFQARGFYPAVSVEKRHAAQAPGAENAGNAAASSLWPEGGGLLVSAYLKDRLLEEGLFAALRQDVADLPPIRRHIVHEDELAAALRPALNRAGLDYALVSYLPGRVEVSGPFGPDDWGRARLVLDETGEKLGVPLRSVLRSVRAAPDVPAAGETVADDGTASQVLSALSTEPGPAPASGSTAVLPELFDSDPLGGLRVTGVTMTPLRFVTTADGQRLFEGAMLPGGYTLEAIATTTLTLRKGGQAVTYKLRGAS